MRIMAHLSARTDMEYDNTYHDKLHGRLWSALKGTEYNDRHDSNEPPGFVPSNPFPPRDANEGDERKLLVASVDERLLAHIAADLLENRELNLGWMAFEVDDVTPLAPDVGEPGTSGTMRTSTGLLIRIPPGRCDEYGIEHPNPEGNTAVFWKSGHSIEPLRQQLESNLDKKHRIFAPEYLPGPSDVDGELFDEYEMTDEFAVPVQVTEQQRMTYVLTKWEFGYTVRNDDHRRHLNLALDVGLGGRNALGFGFMNIIERDGTAV